MSENSAIEWTDATWNPTTGCTKVSPGCANCYIERTPPFRMQGRRFENGHIPVLAEYGQLEKPLHWRKPRRVFVNSLSDLFHPDVSDVFIERVFSVMSLAKRHTFQLLTKRPSRMLAWFKARRFDVKNYAILQTEKAGECLYAHPWPLPNVWLGVSVENQHFADERIPLLLETPAALRFISAEPLVGPVDLKRYMRWVFREGIAPNRDGTPYSLPAEGGSPGLDWVIVGGESGSGARQFDLAWARSIIEQCHAAGVPCFVKQLGANVIYTESRRSDERGHLVDLRNRKGGDPSEWPEFFRVRQFPESQHAFRGCVI